MPSPSLVIENTLPGVTVLINQAQVARPIVRQPTSTFFAVGYSIWGPVAAPRATTSWADYIRQFGGLDPNSHLADAIYAFYKMGGRTAVISRVVGAAAARATATLKDRSGTAQVETATVVGTITLAGDAEVIVTAAGMTGSPKTFQVPVLLGDTASVVAGKIRTALAADAALTALYAVSGAGANVVLTRLAPFAANDATLNIDIDNGTCTGLTPDASSTDTTAGVAALNTLKIDAKYPSTRVDIRYTVEAGTAANTVKLTFRSLLLNRREIFDDFLISAAKIDEVNQASKLVELTNLGSVTAAPNNLPVVTPASLLTGGNDDFAGLAAADYIGVDGGPGARTGLQIFNDETLDGLGGTGQVAIPGLTTVAVHAALNTHASTYHRLALADPPFGSDAQDVIAIRQQYGTWYMALYWPWVECLDFAGSGLNRFYPPSGFAAGACAKVDRTIGTHKAPANESIPFALGVEKLNGQPQTDDGTREQLNGKDICVITPLPEQGVKIYGARVMTGDRRVQMVHQIRMLNLFYYSAKIGYQWAPFSVVDGQGRLFRDLRASGAAFLKPYWEVGALFGKTEEKAFIVIADDSNNPPEELEAQRVHVQWGVYLSPTAEVVIVNIDNVPLFQGLDVLTQ
jgi:phage tail sheath protein FI